MRLEEIIIFVITFTPQIITKTIYALSFKTQCVSFRNEIAIDKCKKFLSKKRFGNVSLLVNIV